MLDRGLNLMNADDREENLNLLLLAHMALVADSEEILKQSVVESGKVCKEEETESKGENI